MSLPSPDTPGRDVFWPTVTRRENLDQPKHVVVALCSNHRLYEIRTSKMYTTCVNLYKFDQQICGAVGSYSPEVVVVVQI